MEEPKDKKPGVIASPPLIYLGFLVAGLVLNYLWPIGFLPGRWRAPLAALLTSIGFVLVTLGLHEFRRVGTDVSPHKPSTALATGGIYAHTRNPLYLALTFVYLGIAAATNDLWLLPLTVPLLIVIRYGVIGREERYLRVRFGEVYRQYQERVRRWM